MAEHDIITEEDEYWLEEAENMNGLPSKGPWTMEKVSYDDNDPGIDGIDIKNAKGINIGVVWKDTSDGLLLPYVANGNLMIAAPDLLEACEAGYDTLRGEYGGPDELRYALNKLKQAIAKAKG